MRKPSRSARLREMTLIWEPVSGLADTEAPLIDPLMRSFGFPRSRRRCTSGELEIHFSLRRLENVVNVLVSFKNAFPRMMSWIGRFMTWKIRLYVSFSFRKLKFTDIVPIVLAMVPSGSRMACLDFRSIGSPSRWARDFDMISKSEPESGKHDIGHPSSFPRTSNSRRKNG